MSKGAHKTPRRNSWPPKAKKPPIIHWRGNVPWVLHPTRGWQQYKGQLLGLDQAEPAQIEGGRRKMACFKLGN